MLSSHLVADLERVCDYLVVLVASKVQVAGEVSELLVIAPPAFRGPPGPGQPASEPGSHRGKPYRQAEHVPGPHQ